MSIASVSPVHYYQDDLLSFLDLGSPAPSHGSCPSLLGEVEPREPNISDDKGLSLEQPVFIGLFPPAIFKSLLFKVSNVVQLGSPATREAPPPSHEVLNPLFSELTKPVDAIPVPHLFLDVVQ